VKSILILCGKNYKRSSVSERESRQIACGVLQQCKSARAIHANLLRRFPIFLPGLQKTISAAARWAGSDDGFQSPDRMQYDRVA
jgi:hypothetical protein